MKTSLGQTIIKIILVIFLVGVVAFAIYGWQTGLFSSLEELQSYISGFGIGAIGIFILFQAVQVVIPFLPANVGCMAGVLLFGPVRGFIFNYTGIVIGSILAFLIGRYYGRSFLERIFSPSLLFRYDAWTKKKDHFARLFTAAIVLPVAPDDFLCYLAGTTSMSFSRFLKILLLGKPFAVALYTVALMMYNHISA